jgi:hypothetical protein
MASIPRYGHLKIDLFRQSKNCLVFQQQLVVLDPSSLARRRRQLSHEERTHRRRIVVVVVRDISSDSSSSVDGRNYRHDRKTWPTRRTTSLVPWHCHSLSLAASHY